MSDEKDFERLIKKHASLKRRLTEFATYLNAINVLVLNSTDATELQMCNRVEGLYNIDEIQTQQECLADNMTFSVNWA